MDSILVTRDVAFIICATLIFILVLLAVLLSELGKILDLLRPATGFTIYQGRKDMPITGEQAGGSGKFTAKPNGALQAGNVPAWSSTDANVSIAPAGDGLSATVNLAQAETGASFPLTVSGVNSAGAAISSSVSVPVLPAAATGFDIEQTA